MPEPSVTAGMKAGGFYDVHSEYQRRVIDAGVKSIREMVDSLDLTPVGSVVTIADYGCGTGATTARSVGLAAQALRERDRSRTISAVHCDQVTNDFNQVLRTAHETYVREVAGPLFVSAVGGSFFEQLTPTGSVHLGMCSNAAHWFRRQPEMEMPAGMYFSAARGEARQQLARMAAEDWVAFLRARGAEILSGGRMLVQGIATVKEGEVSAEGLLRLMWEVGRTMAKDGLLLPLRKRGDRADAKWRPARQRLYRAKGRDRRSGESILGIV